MTTGKTIALTRRNFVGKVMSLLLNMLSRLVITFLSRSKRLLISLVMNTFLYICVVLEKTLESPLDWKEIQPVHSKGNQSWVFTGRTDAKAETPVLWPPHAKC